MEKTTKEYEITPTDVQPVRSELSTYVLKDYEELKQKVEEKVNDKIINELVIRNQGDYKFIKETRTEIRKLKDLFKSVRTKTNEIVIGTYNSQIKELEKLLDDEDNLLKQKVEDYDQNVLGKVKEKTITLTIKSANEELITKIIEYASSIGLENIKKQ